MNHHQSRHFLRANGGGAGAGNGPLPPPPSARTRMNGSAHNDHFHPHNGGGDVSNANGHGHNHRAFLGPGNKTRPGGGPAGYDPTATSTTGVKQTSSTNGFTAPDNANATRYPVYSTSTSSRPSPAPLGGGGTNPAYSPSKVGVIAERGNGGGAYYYSSGAANGAAGNTGTTPTSSLSSSAPSPLGQPPPRTQSYRTTTTTLTTAEPKGGANEVVNGGMERESFYQPHRTSTLPGSRGGVSQDRPNNYDIDPPPSYQVEHLASFAVGRQYGLVTPTDGVRKLKQMERNSAVWAQPMIMRLLPDRVSVEEDSGEVVEQFPMDLVVDPTAHHSSDPADMFNNVLLFVVKEDTREHAAGQRPPGEPPLPTEMHIFQCIHVPSQEVAQDVHNYIKGNYHKVRGGMHDNSVSSKTHQPTANYYGYGGGASSPHRQPHQTEHFEMDVNTLNRCFDDIERFVARIQSAAIAQRELEMQQMRLQGRKHSKKAVKEAAVAAQRGILQLRAQMPSYNEFFEIFQKFKLSFNLLAKLKNHIHEPNAPELLHFLFTPLTVILDACHWGLGRNVAEQVLSPLLSMDACDLLRNCLSSKEHDVWMALGASWRTPPQEWVGAILPAPYRPVFSDGFAPYGYPPQHFEQQSAAQRPVLTLPSQQPIYGARVQPPPGAMHRGVSAPPPSSQPLPPGMMGGGGGPPPSAIYGTRPAATGPFPYGRERSVDNLRHDLESEKLNLEKERLEFERMKVLDREQQLLDKERRLRDEEARLDSERRMLHKEAEKRSIAESDRPDFYRGRDNYSSVQPSPHIDRRVGSVQALSNGGLMAPPMVSTQPMPSGHTNTSSNYSSPRPTRPIGDSAAGLGAISSSPKQKAYLDELIAKKSKCVQVTYDRVAQNPKELTVARGDYLEVLQDNKNWWECRNAQGRLGYVPHTILSVVHTGHQPMSNISSPRGNGAPVSMGLGSGGDADGTPDYIKERQGKRGEFRYF